jgi:hypothetical protein
MTFLIINNHTAIFMTKNTNSNHHYESTKNEPENKWTQPVFQPWGKRFILGTPPSNPILVVAVVHVDGMKHHLWAVATNRSTVHATGDMWIWTTMVELQWLGKTEKLKRKTCPSATLSTTNPTWINPGVNLGLRSERLAANQLSHGTANPILITVHLGRFHFRHMSAFWTIWLRPYVSKRFWEELISLLCLHKLRVNNIQYYHLHTRFYPNPPIDSKVIEGSLCTHLRSLNVCHFGMTQAKRLKYVAS